MQCDPNIYVAGHTGLIGSALVRRLTAAGRGRLLLRGRAELELTDPAAVEAFFQACRPEVVFLAAGRAGGIQANRDRPAEFVRQNLAIQTNVMHSAARSGVRRLVFLGCACAYPARCPQPIRPEMLLTGGLEPTSEPFAVAKIAGIKLAQACRVQYGAEFISVIPASVYGPNDRFGDDGHVIGSLMARMHAAKLAGAGSVAVWGTGRARREFIHADDLADALVLLTDRQGPPDLVNVGAGAEVTIAELAEQIRQVVGFAGRLDYDPGRPDGAPRRLLDAAYVRSLGWRPGVALDDGLRRTYQWYLENSAHLD